jgi:hypothetical protein
MHESTPLVRRKIKVLHLWRQYLLPTKQVFLVVAWRGYTQYYFSPKYCPLMKIDVNVNLTAEIYFVVCQGIKMSMKKNVFICEYIQDKIPVI